MTTYLEEVKILYNFSKSTRHKYTLRYNTYTRKRKNFWGIKRTHRLTVVWLPSIQKRIPKWEPLRKRETKLIRKTSLIYAIRAMCSND